MFAEFLLFLLVFPWVHTSVGLTVVLLGDFLVVWSVVQYPLCLGPVKVRWGVRSDLHVCGERGYVLLLLMLAWSLPCLHGTAW